MDLVGALSKVRSQAAKRVLEFYRRQEAECDRAPWAWRDGHSLKASEMSIELQLLTEQLQMPSQPPDALTGPIAPNSQVQTLSGKLLGKLRRQKSTTGQIEPPTLGSMEEIAESLYEYPVNSSIRQRETWGQVFQRPKARAGARVLFNGGPGSGKSFSLSQEVRRRLSQAKADLERGACSPDDLEVPLFIKASALVESNQEDIAAALLESVTHLPASLAGHVRGWWCQAFAAARGRRLFIVIDGLDELREEHQARFREQMSQLGKLEAATLIISCRTMYFAERRNWVSWAGDGRTRVVELAPLEEKQQLELIEKFKRPDVLVSETLPGLLKRNYALKHCCRTPLLLTLACLLHAEGKLSEQTSYHLLYQGISVRLLRGDWKDDASRPAWMKCASKIHQSAAQKERLAFLAAICWELFAASPSENRFSVAQWQEAARQAVAKGFATNINAVDLLSEVERVGLVIDAGYNAQHEDCYSFMHRTLLEYLAARGLIKQRSETEWVSILTQHIWCEAAWVEVICFAASAAENPNLLLNELEKEVGSALTLVGPSKSFADYCNSGFKHLFGFYFLALCIFGGFVLYSTRARGVAKGYLGDFITPFLSNIIKLLPWILSDPFTAVNFLAHGLQRASSVFFQLIYEVLDMTLDSDPMQMAYRGYLAASGVLMLAMLMWLGKSLARKATKLLHWLALSRYDFDAKLNRDDIFRTGLRVQAEVIGLNRAASVQHIERIAKELLVAEQNKSANFHGATEQGGMPENLLLIFGSNGTAREILCANWFEVISNHCKQLERTRGKYNKALSWYRWLLSLGYRDTDSSRFTARDFRQIEELLKRLQNSGGAAFSGKYIHDKLSSETQELLGKITYSTPASEKARVLAALTKDFNIILQDATLYDHDKFRFSHWTMPSGVVFRTETRDLLKEQPMGRKLERLNRLLLEDAYPKHLKRMQRRWLRIVSALGRIFVKWPLCESLKKSRLVTKDTDTDVTLPGRMLKMLAWCWRVPVTDNTELFLALRGVSLLPVKTAEKPLNELSKQLALTTKLLDEVQAPFGTDSFTNLDILIAKALTALDDKARAVGVTKLAEFARCLEESKKYKLLAIQELGLFDKPGAIRIATECIKDERKASHESYSWESELKFYDFLLGLPHALVISEIEQLAETDEAYIKPLVQFVCWLENETAILWLRKTGANELRPVFAKAAQDALNSSSNKPWIDPSSWLDGESAKIRKLWNSNQFDLAESEFDKLVGSYYWEFAQEVLLNNPDKIALLCDEKLLNFWSKKREGQSGILRKLGILANEPEGKVVKEALIRWAKDYFIIDEYSGYTWKKELLIALGDIGAEELLLEILQKARKKSYLWGVAGTNCNPGLYVALGKVGSDEVLRQLQHEVKKTSDWVLHFVTARLLAERNDPQALELFLEGKKLRGDKKWEAEFGPEPTIWHLAWRFGARITKVKNADSQEYLAASQSRGFKFRVRA